MAKKKNTKKPYSERQKLSLIVGSIGLAVFLITGQLVFGGLDSPFTKLTQFISGGQPGLKYETNYLGIIGLALAVGGAVGFFVYKDD
mgnify:CR=1 FL=1